MEAREFLELQFGKINVSHWISLVVFLVTGVIRDQDTTRA